MGISEGAKVRTFSLKLICDLQDADVDEQLKERVVEKAKVFFENKTVKGAATFATYREFITSLSPENNTKIQKIAANHLGLIDLQAKLPKEPSYTGYFPLFAMIDLLGRAEVGGSAKLRFAIEWLLHHLITISLSELHESISTQCKNIQGDYTILFIKWKSQEWVADLAIPYLSSAPNEALSFSIENFEHSPGKAIEKGSSDHFLIFDDGAYSGTQLKYILQLIYDTSKKSKTPKKVTLILGYGNKKLVTKMVENIKARLAEDRNIDVEIMIGINIPTIREIVEKEKIDDDLSKAIYDLLDPGLPFVIPQWKTPDNVSLADIFSDGSLEETNFKYTLPFNHTPWTHNSSPYKQSNYTAKNLTPYTKDE
ncbi:MAG: hypothetical protein P0S94_02315 [Simkaniaceae bacterium]|nr:hypothetical protein [Simkaniaceae bacterium]